MKTRYLLLYILFVYPVVIMKHGTVNDPVDKSVRNPALIHSQPLPQPLVEPIPEPEKDPLACMTMNLYREAGNSTALDMAAIGRVVIQRAEDRRWKDDICGVVYERKQFSWTNSATLRKKPKLTNPQEARAFRMAHIVSKQVLQGKYKNLVPGATHYHATYVSPYWVDSMVLIGQTGAHLYYKG